VITFSPLDGLALAVVVVAILRGVFIGLIREGFSIAALGAAFVAVRLGTPAASTWLQEVTGGEIGAGAAPWIAGALIGVATVAAVATAGSFIRRGARAAGLSWADRIGGGALGAAEGALVAGLLVLAATWLIGRDDPVVADSRSLRAFDEIQAYVQERSNALPDVAAPRNDRGR